jgi:glycosyltransferase involved in cell wall biosynthesis
MPKLINSISVFFPAYNEEANITYTVSKAKQVLDKVADTWEIIIINDGSKDKTLQIAEGISRQDNRVRIIDHGVNRGYGASLKSGFYGSKYPWIAFTDSDGQFDFADISEFIKKQEETKADLVIGYYLRRKVSLLTKFSSKVWELLVWLLFGLRVKDIDCAFKFISKDVFTKIPKLESERGAFISSELLIKAKKAGFKIVQVGVHHFPRKAGKATGRKLNVIIQSFADLFKLWIKLKK